MIDLHIHTNCSDGLLTPYEVIDYASSNGIKIISITDHDTIDAYTDDILNYAKDKNVKLIPGVEISTKLKCGIHILGYNIDIKNKVFKEKLKSISKSRHVYLNDVALKLKELGYLINVDKLDEIESVTKAHIANDVIGNPLNNDILIKNFNHIPSKGEFIETAMNEGCSAYVKKNTITPKEASEIIKAAGGKVVLAHPAAYKYEDGLTIEDIENIVLESNIDGIESYYIYIDRYNVSHNDIDIYSKLSKKLSKFETVGSDFHSFDNIHPKIGSVNIDIDLNDIIKNISID